MSDRELTIGDLREAMYHLPDGMLVTAGVQVGENTIPVRKVEFSADRVPMIVIVPPVHASAPAPATEDPTLDADLSRIAENMVKGVDTTFQVPFTMALMKECGADHAQARLHALAMYFSDAADKIEEIIRFGQEAGEMAEAEDT